MLFALSLIELIVFGLFFLALIVGTSYDRRGVEDWKWWIVVVGVIIAAVYYWSDFTVAGLWDTIRTWGFWAPVLTFFGIGLVYSLLEFGLYVRREARLYSDEWKTHLSQYEDVNVLDVNGNPRKTIKKDRFDNLVEVIDSRRRPYSEVYDDVRENGATSKHFDAALGYSNHFVNRFHFKNEIIQLKLSEATKVDVVPVVAKAQLAQHIAAWTTLWPAYAVSLILGDLMVEVFNFFADVLAKISGQFVKLSFANVFKF